MQEMMPTPYEGKLRKHTLKIPSVIRKCSGIYIFGRRIRSLVFSTDLAIINNVDADAVLAVHPFTPQLRIIQGIVSTSDIPVFAGVGGGLTQGARVTQMAILAESQGAIGVVVNAPTDNASIRTLANNIELPVVVTVVNEDHDIGQRLESGAAILNVSAAKKTPELVRTIRKEFPQVPIIATGGPTEETIRETISAGANAITWTPPSTAELFASIMQAYRENQPHP
ncbi:MAG: hydrolase [Clostridiales bacterium]|nr:MAG: hydrolase [Clostridiales bacterium]